MTGSIAANDAGSDSSFAGYLAAQSIPVARASMRKVDGAAVTMALIDHAPNPGNWFDPIEEVVVSIVLQAERSTVVRDFGYGRTELRYASGLILVSPPSRPSFWRFDGYPLILHLGFPADMLASLLGADDATSAESLIAEAARTPRHDTLISKIAARMWASSGANFEAALTTHALGTILGLVLDARDDGKPSGGPGKSRLSSWKLQRALAIIGELKQRVRVSALAAQLGMSTDHFIRTFKATTGVSPHEMASELAVGEGKRLLRETGESVTAIAMELGYSSPAHFSERFKQSTGMSPSQWRATYAN